MSKRLNLPIKGRGSVSNPDNRFDDLRYEAFYDGWGGAEHQQIPEPELIRDSTRKIINYNTSPDVPFDRSINPYRGCEHGCVYCFARPTHAYLSYSPGLDFETKIHYKPEAAERLRKELESKSYRCEPIALGINTDAYQPVERRLKITRSVLQVLQEYRHPLSIVTKSAMIERDIDILAEMAEDQLVQVMISVTTLDSVLSRKMEPRTAAPHRRLKTISKLNEAGIPVGILYAPVIPFLNDAEMEQILSQCREAGAMAAGYVFLRLPHELKELFTQWLDVHFPMKAKHIMNLIRDSRGGQEYDATFGKRMRGEGEYADLIAKRFRLAYQKCRFSGLPSLSKDHFQTSLDRSGQLELFAK